MRKELIKTEKGFKCPYCNEFLNEDTLRHSQSGIADYKLFLDSEGNINYEQVDFESNDDGEFYCVECGKILFDYDEELAKEILKGGVM